MILRSLNDLHAMNRKGNAELFDAGTGERIDSLPSPPRVEGLGERAKPKLVPFAYDPPGTWTIPIKLESEANMGGKMRGKMTRNKTVKEAIYRALGPYWSVWGPVGDRIRELGKLDWPKNPFHPSIIVTRLGGRGLDTVNLWSSVKFVEDAIANLMGCNDGTPVWKRTFDVRQEPGERFGVRVEIQ